MKKKKIISGTIIFLCSLLLFTVVLFNSCGPMYYSYTFKNQTRYTIYVTVNNKYRITDNNSDTTDPTNSKNTPITLYNNSKVEIYDVAKSPLDFKWTASYSDYNSLIYVTVNGTTATFKEK